MRAPTIVVCASLISVALVGFLFVRTTGPAGSADLTAQGRPLTAGAVAAIVKVAPGPVNPHGLRARCIAQGKGALRNPWRCRIRYASGQMVQYTVQVRPDGSYVGYDQVIYLHGARAAGKAGIRGCCIPLSD